MEDLQHLDSYWKKPFVAVLSYLTIPGIDLFGELKFAERKYIYFVLHVMMTVQIFRFLCEAISSGVDLISIATELSFLLITLESGCLLYAHFFYSLKKIKTFVSKLGEEWRGNETLSPDLIAFGRNELKSFTRFNSAYLAGITVFVYSYMLIPPTITVVKKFIFKKEVAYLLPFRFSIPFQFEDNFLLFVTYYGLAFIMTLNLSYLINGGMVLLSTCLSHLRVLFVILQHEFKDIFNSKEDFNVENKIKSTVRKHSRLLELINELSDAFGAMFAIHLLLLSAVICFFGITAMINGNLGDLKNLMASIISIITIYHCCYQGQLLTDSAVDVGTATYDSEWYSLSCKHKKIVLIIILRSQKVSYIQSTGFTYISLTNFVKIMNMAWSFVSLINGMYDS